MKENIKPNPQDVTTQDAEMAAESMQENPKAAPAIDFEDDYRLAQKMAGNPSSDEEISTRNSPSPKPESSSK
ncbi:MAG: hypothetical protein VKK04_03925 [Synechococcales bacterium]|nr:hypothetical protein [Synechococcales bacterium]